MGTSNSCFKSQQQHESPISSQPATNLECSGPSFDQMPVQKKKRTRYVSKGTSGEHPNSTSSVGETNSPDVSSGNGQSPRAIRQGYTYDIVQHDRQYDGLLKQFSDMLEQHQKRMEEHLKRMDERLRVIEQRLDIVSPDNRYILRSHG